MLFSDIFFHLIKSSNSYLYVSNLGFVNILIVVGLDHVLILACKEAEYVQYRKKPNCDLYIFKRNG